MTTNRHTKLDPFCVVNCIVLGIALGATAGDTLLRVLALIGSHSWRLP